MKNCLNKAVFNLKEAAEYLGLSQPTLLDLLSKNEIAYRRAGKRRWLISKSVLNEWLARSSEGENGREH